MKPIFTVTRLVSALFALAISFTALAEIPQLKLVNAYPNLKVKRPLWMQQLPDGRMVACHLYPDHIGNIDKSAALPALDLAAPAGEASGTELDIEE